MKNSSTPGIRNNNPGNIRLSEDKWQGLAEEQSDNQFFVFQTPVYGIRAAARLLINYQDKYGLRTIHDIISKWAPSNENDTNAYISSVVKCTGFAVGQQLDMHSYEHLKSLVTAIIWQENGQQPYSNEQIDKALVLAGVEAALKPLTKTPAIRGAQVAASTGAVAAASGIIAQAAPAMPVLSAFSQMAHDNAQGLLIALGVLVIITAAYTTWSRIDERRKGIS